MAGAAQLSKARQKLFFPRPFVSMEAIMGYFGGKDSLPMHSGNRRNNGVKGIPVVDKGVLFSLIWALLSIALVFVGYFHCRAHAFSYTLDCKSSQCLWSTTNATIPTVNFHKADFLDAELVRIDEQGQYVDASRMKERRGRYGYTVRLKLRLPVEEGSKLKVDREFLFAPYDLSRRTAKAAVNRMRAFLDNTKAEAFNFSKGRAITALGIMCMFFGCISLLLSCMFGQWIEAAPRRLKKAS